jgi:hypothetical protein
MNGDPRDKHEDRGPLRRTFHRLEIEDAEERPGIRTRIKRLFKRRKRQTSDLPK